MELQKQSEESASLPGHDEQDNYKRSLKLLGGLFVGLLFLGIMFYIFFRVQSAPLEEEPEVVAVLPTAVPTKKIDQLEKVGKVFWSVPPRTIAPETAREIKAAFATYEPKISEHETLDVVSVQISSMSASFGAASMRIRDKNRNVKPMDGFEFLLDKTTSTWRITAGGGDQFCVILRSMPLDMLETRTGYYTGCFPELL